MPRRGLLAIAILLLVPSLAMVDAAAPVPTAVVHALGVETFEPTLGVAPDGAIYYSTTPVRGVAIGFGTGVHRSDDGGATWRDVTPKLGGVRVPPETNDPYVYVDPDTGRVFQFAMAPILVCSILSWSDDGGDSWTTNPHGCGSTPPWDHQSMVAGKARTLTTTGYPSVLYQCVNTPPVSVCSRSLDGGLTWAPSGMPASTSCSGLHGHLVTAPDGTVYLPKDVCGRPQLYISKNDGTTWTPAAVSMTVGHGGGPDPAVAVDKAGNVYFVWVDTDFKVRMAVSTNGGTRWGPAHVVSPPGVTANLPTVAALGVGKVAISYAGSENLPSGYASTPDQVKASTWNAYLAVTVDGTAATPTVQTFRANPLSDPLVRGACGPGRCPGMVDFIDVQIGPDGTPYAALVDACTGLCASDPTKGNNASQAILVTLRDGPSLA